MNAIEFARIEGKIDECLRDHGRTAGALTAIDDRLRVCERLIWVSVGGVLVIGGLLNYFSGTILKAIAA